jgi:hypothetical protein
VLNARKIVLLAKNTLVIDTHNLRYAAVEEDCNTALALEDDYVKAFLRRGVARRHLGKLTQAVHGEYSGITSL